MQAFIDKHCRGVTRDPNLAGSCLQTNVEDNNFVLDFLPDSDGGNKVAVFCAGWWVSWQSLCHSRGCIGFGCMPWAGGWHWPSVMGACKPIGTVGILYNYMDTYLLGNKRVHEEAASDLQSLFWGFRVWLGFGLAAALLSWGRGLHAVWIDGYRCVG